MDLDELKHALAGLPLGEMRYYDTLDSTNLEAARWAEEKAGDLSLVIADEQTAGRGRDGRQWFTPPGAALACSLILRFSHADDPPRLLSRLTALGGLAVCDALIQDYALPAELKWPNDVLIRRRKTAGLLSEAHWQGDQLTAVILGIGVNVHPPAVPPLQKLLYPATCVSEEAGCSLDRLKLLHFILLRLLNRKKELESAQFLLDWENYLAFKGEWVQILEKNRTLEGRLLGLNPDGSLRLAPRSGQVISIYAGDLRLRPLN